MTQTQNFDVRRRNALPGSAGAATDAEKGDVDTPIEPCDEASA